MANNSGITITNFNQVLRHMTKLDLADKYILSGTRKALRIPFNKMRKDSRKNLKSQGSLRSGELYKGLSVRASLSKKLNYFTVVFGGKAPTKKTVDGKKSYTKTANHFHLVNSGTVKRRHKSGKNVGAVGKGKSNRSNMNKSFQIGFADRAIKPVLGTIQTVYVKEFNSLLNSIKTKGV